MLEDHAETIASAYALGPVVDFAGPVARGQQGEVWRLRTGRGTFVVKRSFAETSLADAQRTGEFQSLARAHGVPAPVAVATGDRRYGLEVAGTVVRVAGWVDLADSDPMIDPAAVGRVLARLHRVVRPADGTPDPWFTEPVGADAWDEILAEARRQRAPFADRLAGCRSELLALEALLTPMEPVQTCHLDLWADNVRATPEGGLMVLDWDNCGPGDPSRELAMVLLAFGEDWPAPGIDPRRVAALSRAYREAGGPGQVRDPSDFAVLIAIIGHVGEMHLRRWLDPATDAADRARAAHGLGLFLDRPLTRAVLDDILAAVGG